MILVRIVFQTKWGKAHEVVEAMKAMESLASEFGGKMRILTDLSGPFHTVVQEIEVESLEEYAQTQAKLFNHPQFQKAQPLMEALIESGYREFYTIES